MNVDFAFYFAIRLLLTWNIDEINTLATKELFQHDTSTKLFVAEHKTWLKNLVIANPFVIFSNMQTMRLLQYWIKSPNKNINPLPKDIF